MKRVGNLFDRIVDRDNLRLAFAKAVRGKRDRAGARRFAAHLDQQLASMAEQLRSGTFPLGRCHQFVIYDPKERVITAPDFPERSFALLLLETDAANALAGSGWRHADRESGGCGQLDGSEQSPARVVCGEYQAPTWLHR